jgi:hypothetical protein
MFGDRSNRRTSFRTYAAIGALLASACSAPRQPPSPPTTTAKVHQIELDAQARFRALDAAVARHSIPDAMVDRNIDPQIKGAQRAYVKKMMLRLPPFARQHVAGYDPSGHFYSNRAADYAEMAHQGPWVHLYGNVWRKPNGEVVAVPGL